MKILSLFDGMACGYIAFKNLGIDIKEYHAYEIDKYATKTATHNFPDIKEHGDVFAEDFSKYSGSVDWLIGGSPCTYWSIAQTKNRETVASGMGWELFSQYVRALHESKPKYFLYENNKSMSQAIRESICEAFGFEPVLINSALVSAQNRQRLYWVGIRQEDGTYKRANIDQPQDRGILLKDILDTNRTTFLDKAHTIDATYYKASDGTVPFNGHQSSTRLMAAEKVLSENEMDYMVRDSRGNYSDRWSFLNKPAENDKSVCITANVRKGVPYNIVAEPVCVRQIGRNPENPKSRVAGLPTEQMYEARFDKKTNTLTTVQKDNMVALPINVTEDGKAQCLRATCYKDGIRNIIANDVDRRTGVAEPVCLRYERTEEGKALRKQYEAHEIEHGYREHQVLQPRTDGKTNTLSTVQKDNLISEPICLNSKSGRGGVEGIQPSLQDRIYSVDGKMTAVTTAFNPNIAEPVRAMNYELESVENTDEGVVAMLDMPKQHDQLRRVYGTNGKCPTLVAHSGGNTEPKVFEEMPECFRIREATTKGYTDIEPGDRVDYGMPNSKTRRGRNMKDKSNCLQTSCSFYQYCGTVKAPIYEVKDGMIEVKGKKYPIKLVDGYYIIRKLTVTECMRLQTVPEWYEWPVSNSQAYKMLGNGWTVEVIMHLIKEATK